RIARHTFRRVTGLRGPHEITCRSARFGTRLELVTDSARGMPDVDRVAANRAAIEARRARADLKERLRSGETSPLKAIERSAEHGTPEATLRITDFLLALPS